MKSHYTYRLTAVNPVDERVEYIGVRSCECLPEEDTRYLGSSRHLPRDLEYRKEILAVWPTRAEAVAHEVALHDLHDVARSPRFFNKAKQKTTGFDAGVTCGGDKHWTRNVDRERLSGTNNPNYGKRYNASVRLKMAVARTGLGTGDVNGMRNPEVVKKLSGDNHWSKTPENAGAIGRWVKSRVGAKNSEKANAANRSAAQKRMNDKAYVARLGKALSATFAKPDVKRRMSDAVTAAAALRKTYCQAHGITNPGKGYCNIDKAAFSAWLAQQEAPR
jgi:hypothetical protein